MSHPCLSAPSAFRKNTNDSQDEKLPANKKARIAFDAIESMDASAYLSGVMREAKAMPNIFVAGNDTAEGSTLNETASDSPDKTMISPAQRNRTSIDGSVASLSYLLSKRSSIIPPPSIQHLPKVITSDEWSESVVSNFERLRGYLERSKAKGFGGKQTARKPLPTMKDRPSWHIFCVGVDEARGNSGAYFADDYDTTTNTIADEKHKDDDDDKTEDIPAWRKNLPEHGYEPSVCLLLQMDQVMVRRVLSHLAYYVNLGWSVTSGRRAEWIYALLARLEKPVHRDDAAVLFGLLKKLTMARSKIDPGETNRSNLAKLNVLIVIVGKYFEQAGSLHKIMTCE